YRIGDPDRAMVFVGLAVRGASDVEAVHQSLRAAKFDFVDLSDDEIAKLHVRHMVGGRSDAAHDERVFRVEFPERAGCLAEFLGKLDPTWNIS
ncbi:threonine ammonia-lyase, biosynthetic, partial [Acinetobacter baumannii]